ncbi:cell wall-binding protein [Pectobacterium brasiliense]|uniref:hypothetical protein n=1 Tax=Pectobacterium brasiliense TaxID=180957 RepID=UPI00069A1B2E|nr:hypothetical protein [Pectobacterium brasiliense]MCG5049417.1 cell wall-binding protein [Pectobacterium brasiliense]
MKKYSLLAIIISSSFFLAGCSDEPSEKDIYNAFNDAIEDSRNASGLTGYNPEFLNNMLKSIKKINCSEQQGKNYKCNIEIVIENKKVEREVNLTKTDKGWRIPDRIF